MLLTECQACRDPLLEDIETCPRCGTPNRAFAGGFDPGPRTPLFERLFDVAFASVARRSVFLIGILILVAGFLTKLAGLEDRIAIDSVFGGLLAILGGVILWRRRVLWKRSSKR